MLWLFKLNFKKIISAQLFKKKNFKTFQNSLPSFLFRSRVRPSAIMPATGHRRQRRHPRWLKNIKKPCFSILTLLNLNPGPKFQKPSRKRLESQKNLQFPATFHRKWLPQPFPSTKHEGWFILTLSFIFFLQNKYIREIKKKKSPFSNFYSVFY